MFPKFQLKVQPTTMDDSQQEPQESQETPVDHVFRPPSINSGQILDGTSYTYYSDLPSTIASDENVECVLGIDEAGRGPVLGPMVYAAFYLPLPQERTLLAETHHFDDSKVLTPAVRSSLMQTLCTPSSDLHKTCGWATSLLSARDISANMLKPTGAYNLNAQAMDATIALIQGVLDRRANVKEIYIDTIGRPETYQKKLERIFPSMRITVAKKADSLYPCVSAASVCAKVTRDAALEVCWEAQQVGNLSMTKEGWGSGYPSDARCVTWLKREMDPVFGWGVECRFSWGTVKEMLEVKNEELRVDWPDGDGENEGVKITEFFAQAGEGRRNVEGDELRNWYGHRVEEAAF
jgi:ribonuclease H2 subunit A